MSFSRIEALIKHEGLEKLQKAKVAVIGLGGVGGIAAISLARSGVQNIVLCDYDIIEKSNINRQVVANFTTIGQAKTAVLAEMLKNINPNINITLINKAYYNFLEAEKITYIIDAIDDLNSKIALIKDALSLNIPLISSMGAGNKLDPSLVKITKLQKTSYDPLAKAIRKKLPNANIDVVSSTEEVIYKDSIVASYMPVVASFGLLCSDYIIKKIIGS